MNLIKTGVFAAAGFFLAACGASGLTAVPEELQGTWYSEEASKDCDVDKSGIEITAGSIEYIKSFESKWRTSWLEKTREAKGVERESVVMDVKHKYGFANNVLKTEETSFNPTLELKGDSLVITPFLKDPATYKKEKPACDEKYTEELRAKLKEEEAKKAEQKKAADAKAEKRKASPNCAKYVSCTCGMNENVLGYYKKLGIDIPSSSKKATRKFCDKAKKLLDKGTKAQDKACKKALKSIGKSYNTYKMLKIDVPSSCG